MATQPIQFILESGSAVRVTAITPHVFRLRQRDDGVFPEPGLVRYGVVETDFADVPLSISEEDGALMLDTGQAVLLINRQDGSVTLRDASGKVLLQNAEPPLSDPHVGFSAAFTLTDDERLYGLGDETRDRLNKRGHETPIVLRNVVSYVPIPFLMSTAGWAIFLNSTWFHHVDVGAKQADRLVYSANKGELDYYLIAGETLPLLLDRYTEITGRPTLLPLWGYGLTYVMDDRGVRARDVLYEAREFRKEGIPLDLIGLEPEWMETMYDFSTEKKWDPTRFHQPEWMPHQREGGFTAALKNMGFKLSLWLCVDYDVTEYEEHLLRVAQTSKFALDDGGDAELGSSPDAAETHAEMSSIETRYDEDIVKDPHFVPAYQDRITKRGEPWFEHLKKFVDNGAGAFKLDGSNQICFHPDRKWLNGMEDEEVHNLYPVLLAKQMSRGFEEYTGRRPMIYTAGGYAGIQQYAATWAGDTGGGEKPLVCSLNHGLSGHSNTSCDMQVWNAQGIHFGFLQPWSQILCWHQYNQPWFLPEAMQEIFKFYARLRYRLLPYLYSMAHVANRTGMPVMRAMPLVMPDDPRCDELLHQYMLGEWLLTSAFDEVIYLPEGRWIDYWTSKEFEGPMELKYLPPHDRGGPLFIKAGAIIPVWPDLDFIGQCPVESVGLEIFPSGHSEFTLYEDDGETEAYRRGEVVTTKITSDSGEEELTITIAPREGWYQGMLQRRAWVLAIHLAVRPESVMVNDVPVLEMDSGWCYDEEQGILSLKAVEDPSRQAPLVIVLR
jgi:alpha-glucosidase